MDNKKENRGTKKRKRPLTPEEKELLLKRRRIRQEKERRAREKQADEDLQRQVEERKERQKQALARRKRQVRIRIALLVVAVVLVIAGIAALTKVLKQKKLEPDGGTGSNILQAAEDAKVNDGDGGDPSLSGEKVNGGDGGENAIPDPVKDTNSLSICMVGDVILHQRLLDASRTETGYDFSNLFANVTGEIQQYDIKIANQETILGGEALGYSGYPSFNSPYEEADALVQAGFNVILQATNHSLDKGQPAVQNCLHYWNNTYPQIPVLGIHDPYEPSQDNVCLFEKNGIVVAILNYTYGTNQCQEEVASGELAGEVNFLIPELVQQDIAAARQVADYVIVCPHWGLENSLEVEHEQEVWTQYFLNWGVDLVMGTHPHVIQPVRLLTRNDGRPMLVYYSLGNFISNQEDKNGNVGAMAQVLIRKDENGTVQLDNYGVRTTVTHESADGEAFTTYFLDEYPEEMAPANEVTATDPEFSYSYCWQLRDLIFGDLGKMQSE